MIALHLPCTTVTRILLAASFASLLSMRVCLGQETDVQPMATLMPIAASGEKTSQQSPMPQKQYSPASQIIKRVNQIMDEKSAANEGEGQLSEDPVDEGWLSIDPTIFLWLLVFVFLILGCGWYLRRFVAGKVGNVGGQIRVVASCPLSPRSRLFVVEVGEERFLIGEGGGNVSLIGSLQSESSASGVDPISTECGTAEPGNPTFADRLREWEQSVSGRSVSGEVKASLRLLEALSRRLRRGAQLQSGHSERA